MSNRFMSTIRVAFPAFLGVDPDEFAPDESEFVAPEYPENEDMYTDEDFLGSEYSEGESYPRDWEHEEVPFEN
jgi:hypothetical protein